jgi:hypothetical protein
VESKAASQNERSRLTALPSTSLRSSRSSPPSSSGGSCGWTNSRVSARKTGENWLDTQTTKQTASRSSSGRPEFTSHIEGTAASTHHSAELLGEVGHFAVALRLVGRLAVRIQRAATSLRPDETTTSARCFPADRVLMHARTVRSQGAGGHSSCNGERCRR